jgi:hypothetical protein
MTDSQLTPFTPTEPKVDERFEDADAPEAPTDPRRDDMLIGVMIVACPEELEQTVTPLIRSAVYEISTDAFWGDALTVFGPVRLSKLTRWRVLAGTSDSRRVKTALQTHMAEVRLEQLTQVAIGIVVVDQDVPTIEKRMKHLHDSPEFTTLPIHLRGISLRPSQNSLPSNVTAIDRSLGVVRLDNLLIQACRAIMEEAQVAGESTLHSALLTKAIGAGQVSSFNSAAQVAAARLVDEDQAAAHAALLEAAHRVIADPPPAQAMTPLGRDDPYVVTEGLPLRLTYLVVANGAESRPKAIRQRLADLIVGLDQGLIPEPGTIASRTWLVAAGQSATNDPIMRTTGTMRKDDLWRPVSDFLDMTMTMEEIARLVAENKASYERRNQPLVQPLVLFIMPTATLPGARCRSYYRKIRDLADIGWLITDKDAPSPSVEIDTTRLVIDKDDVINELLYSVKYPISPSAGQGNDRSDVATPVGGDQPR